MAIQQVKFTLAYQKKKKVKFTLLEEREDKDILNKNKTQISGLAASPHAQLRFRYALGNGNPKRGDIIPRIRFAPSNSRDFTRPQSPHQGKEPYTCPSDLIPHMPFLVLTKIIGQPITFVLSQDGNATRSDNVLITPLVG